MRRTTPSNPTDAELAILRVLWTHGPSTVKAVHEAMGQATGYTTVLKMLQIMADKGLVRRDETERAHVYEATVSEEHTQRRLLDELVDRAFGGSARQLVLRALDARGASAKELDEINTLLNKLEGGPDEPA